MIDFIVVFLLVLSNSHDAPHNPGPHNFIIFHLLSIGPYTWASNDNEYGMMKTEQRYRIAQKESIWLIIPTIHYSELNTRFVIPKVVKFIPN